MTTPTIPTPAEVLPAFELPKDYHTLRGPELAALIRDIIVASHNSYARSDISGGWVRLGDVITRWDQEDVQHLQDLGDPYDAAAVHHLILDANEGAEKSYCGTSCCVAGYALLLTGADGRTHWWEDKGAELLGLRESQAEMLFSGDRTYSEVVAMLTAIADLGAAADLAELVEG